MFNNPSLVRFWNQYGMLILGLCIAMFIFFHPSLAHASDTGDDVKDLPFVDPLKKFSTAISGPVAFGISLIGIIAAGAVLIFGGEMSGFLRTMVFLVLVIAIIVNASGLIKFISASASVVAAQIPDGVGQIFSIACSGIGLT